MHGQPAVVVVVGVVVVVVAAAAAACVAVCVNVGSWWRLKHSVAGSTWAEHAAAHCLLTIYVHYYTYSYTKAVQK